jgi:hypothetical protein
VDKCGFAGGCNWIKVDLSGLAAALSEFWKNVADDRGCLFVMVVVFMARFFHC